MKKQIYYKTKYRSPLGCITICCDEKENLVGLWFNGQKHFGDTINGKIIKKDNFKIFNKTKSWLDKYFVGENLNIKDIPIKPIGSKFRQEVWKILCKIPYGKTITYGKIAKQIAQKFGKEKMSAQAVGNAVGHNPISIIIPCHRVVGTNGNLTGYASGIYKKIYLLKLENVNMNNLFIPKNGVV